MKVYDDEKDGDNDDVVALLTRQLILLLRYEETICDLVWIEMPGKSC